MKAVFAFVALILSGIFLVGCPSLEVRTRTRIYPDEKALREISICEIDDPDSPPSYLTAAASDAPAPEGGGGGLLSRLVLPDRKHYLSFEKKDKTFHALGLFDDPNKIEPDYQQPSEHIEKSSKNVFTFGVEDYVLFKKFAYSEKYTDIVDRDGYYKAVERGLDLLAELYFQVMEKQYGKDYDLSDLRKAVETEGKPLARKIARLNYELRTQDPSLPLDEFLRILENKVLPLVSAWGLELNLEEDNEERITHFLASKHVELLKPKRPEVPRLSAEQVTNFFEKEFEKMGKEAITEKYSSDEVFDREIEKIAAQVLGIGFSSPTVKFSLEAEMPGIVVQSNGGFSGSRAILEFSDDDLYLVGRTFTVVSALYDGEALGALTSKTLVAREKITIARTFLALDTDVLQKLIEAQKEAVSAGSLEPIRELAKKLPTPAAKQVESILKILE